MAQVVVETPSHRRVVLFGGQGSQSLFSSASVKIVEDITKDLPETAILVSKCHSAFLEELSAIEFIDGQNFLIDPAHFRNSRELIDPPAQYHRNAIIQSTTLCLYQLLHYLAEKKSTDTSSSLAFNSVLEVAGFCSGMLPAVVVAASESKKDFIDFGIQAFRLSFWIGYRAASHSQTVAGPEAADQPWSLVISGLSRSQVQEQLDESTSEKEQKVVRISAVSGPKTVSVSGPSADLATLREHLGSRAITTFAEVQAWYHGGEQLECVARDIFEDASRRKIQLPSWKDLKTPLRSTIDGSLANQQSSQGAKLIEWVVKHLVVHCVEWQETCRGIVNSIQRSQVDHTGIRTQLVSFGPSSNFLLSEFKSNMHELDVELLDLSRFEHARSGAAPLTNRDSIAIVGMGIDLPGGNGQDQLWQTLSKGLSMIQEIPGSRFKLDDYYSPDGTKDGRTMQTRHGAFLDDIWSFDNSFFNISPREAVSMDPQQRILLHTTQAALDDAGYVSDATKSFQRSMMGCYIGIATGDYTDNLRDSIDCFYTPGTLRAFHSGRISYVYKLSGPSIIIDTACSSSAVAIYQACRALQNGDCNSALAGGANVICSPDMYLGLARGHFLSSTGGCKSFDASADGYCRGEGCVMFVLKRLSDAVAEGDRIHGVIRDVVVNQSGNAHSITHPHTETQVDLYRQLLEKTSISAGSIDVIEAHGTGTQAGDTREVASLDIVFGRQHSKGNPLVVSSIKGNIGHSEAASGAASLAKLLLMLRNGQFLPQAGLKSLNPRLTELESGRMLIPQEILPWKRRPNRPRYAVLNNFGAAGSNAALLLEEFIGNQEHESIAPSHRSSYVFNLSAKSKDALKGYIGRYLSYLRSSEASLKDICYTATARREVYDYRISIPCESIKSLLSKLEKIKSAEIDHAKVKKTVVFVFSGQGSIYSSMGRELLQTSSSFNKLILSCDVIMKQLGLPSISAFIAGKELQDVSSDADNIAVTQCAGVALEYALAKLMASWNLVPDYVIGHSLGEYAALVTAEAMCLEDALRVVAFRARLTAERCAPNTSGMLACKLPHNEIESKIESEQQLRGLSVACRNSEQDSVVAGRLEQIKILEEMCSRWKVKAKLLDVPFGYHSAAMDPIVEPLEELGRSVQWSKPKIPVISNLFGRFIEDDDLNSHFFALHARMPVRFAESMSAVRLNGTFQDAICLEIGPHPITLPMMRGALSGAECTFLPTLQRDKPAWEVLCATLSQLVPLTNDIKWREVFADSYANMIDLPSYPLRGTSFAKPFEESAPRKTAVAISYSKLHRLTGFRLLPIQNTLQTSEDLFLFESSTTVLGPLISGHSVGGTPICPASVFHELALEAAHIILDLSRDKVPILEGMTFSSPLIYDPSENPRIIFVTAQRAVRKNSLEFEIGIENNDPSKKTLCCSGSIHVMESLDLKSRCLRASPMVQRQKSYLLDGITNHLSVFQTKILYEAVFTRVVKYSKEYQTITNLSISESSLEGIGTFKIPETSKMSGSVVPPAFTDTLLHAAGFIANLIVSSKEICICARVDSIEILYRDISYSESFTVYCSLADLATGSMVADAFVLTKSGQLVAIIRGMEFQKLPITSFQMHLQQLSTTRHNTMASKTRTERMGNSLSETKQRGLPQEVPEIDNGPREIRSVLTRIISEVSGFPEDELDFSISLDSLGIDSMIQIELATKLKEEFSNQDLDFDSLVACETLFDIEQVLICMLGIADAQHMSDDPTSSPDAIASESETANTPSRSTTPDTERRNPVTMSISKSESVPLCLIHDGSGLVRSYSKLHDLGRNLYAFFDPAFSSSKPRFSSLIQMAEQYAIDLSRSKISSIIIGGWSFGGVVAYEMCELLQNAGIRVKGLVLIDSPYPVDHEPLPQGVISHITRSAVAAFQGIGLAKEFEANASLLSGYEPRPMSKKSRVKTVMLRSEETFDTESICGTQYEWLSSQRTRDRAIAGWEKLIGDGIHVLPIPGHHFEAFTSHNIGRTSAQIRKACQLIEAEPSR